MKLFSLFITLFLIIQGQSQSMDSTADGIGRARLGLFFKRNLDFRNTGSKTRYRREEKSAERLAFPFESEGYSLQFQDDFDTLDRNIWGIGQPWGQFHGQFPHQYYGDSEVFAENGILHLLNRYSPKAFSHADSIINIPYATGLINSWNTKNYTFGYFAIRSKNPSGNANWPAFWLTGKNNWPPEIDVFEMYSGCDGHGIHEQTMTLHFGKIENKTKTLWVKKMQLPENTDTEFHIYSCLWEPSRVTFFTDGVLIKEFRLNQWMDQFYKEPMYVIINNAIDPAHLNCIDNKLLPADFQVDWIRIYQK